MAYGLTDDGFVRMRLPEVRAAILATLQEKLKSAGLDYDIAYRPDTVFGLLIDTFAERETELWETAETVYNAMYPSTAVGVQLDNAGSFTGAIRESAQKSQATVVVFGTAGTTIPAGTQLRNTTTQAIWETASDVTISTDALASCTILPKAAVNTDYTVTVNDTDYTYNSASNADLASILSGLVAVLSDDSRTVTSTGAAVKIVPDSGSINVSLSSSLSFGEIGVSVLATPLEVVDDTAEIGELSAVVTMVDGWDKVTNLTPSIAGSEAENDAEFRIRYKTGVYRTGAGTQPTIAANLLEKIPNATYVKVQENPSDDTVDGMLPHSILCIVEGGEDATVATAIHTYKGAGIDTNGNTTVQIATDYGVQEIKFSRPENVYVWVQVDVEKQAANEGVFPTGGDGTIKEAILAQLSGLGAGEDVVYQSLYKSIYSVDGVESAAVKLYSNRDATASPNSGDYAAQNIAIGLAERAVFDLSRINVTVA